MAGNKVQTYGVSGAGGAFARRDLTWILVFIDYVKRAQDLPSGFDCIGQGRLCGSKSRRRDRGSLSCSLVLWVSVFGLGDLFDVTIPNGTYQVMLDEHHDTHESSGRVFLREAVAVPATRMGPLDNHAL